MISTVKLAYYKNVLFFDSITDEETNTKFLILIYDTGEIETLWYEYIWSR